MPLLPWFFFLSPCSSLHDIIKGFKVLPHRWVVGRTFGWLGRYRRSSKDYEGLTESSQALIYAVMIHLMLRRLGRIKT